MSSYPPKGDEPDLMPVTVTPRQRELMLELSKAIHSNNILMLELLELLKKTLQEET